MLRLGAFDLLDPIGSGGMAEVWSARHHADGTAAAIKVLTSALARIPHFRDAFADEVRAVAALDHPAIVRVYDYGRVPEPLNAGDTFFEEGSPYLAMELLDPAPIEASIDSWPALRELLETLLRALAHAHGHGVIHRDLKPDNILRARSGGAAGAPLKLTDFGIAYAFGAVGSGDREPDGAIVGTPGYMAPEQCRSQGWRVGPWTDLYALGCLAFQLATGELPFARGTQLAVLSAQVSEPPPPLEPRFPSPDGLGAWVERLLAKAPRDRFLCAADALRGLGALEGSPGRLRSLKRPAPSPQLGDVGLGIFGLRAIPLVGREAERARLWGALERVQAQGAGALVLTGPAGCGKSRLAQWLCEEAMERGAAVVLRAVHGRTPGSDDGLKSMIARHLRCQGLTRDHVLQIVRQPVWISSPLAEDEATALVELLGPASRPESEGGAGATEAKHLVVLNSDVERHLVIVRYLQRLAADRPVIVWLDDVQWGPDALVFTARALERLHAAPVLFVLTARDESLAERRNAAQRLVELVDREETERIEVGPIAPSLRGELVDAVLPLEPGLASAVELRTAGNPLFLVHLVGDWIHRGVLEAGPAGFRLVEGEPGGLPDDVHAVWARRVARMFLGRPETERAALELAALLGPVVDAREWGAVCELAGASATASLRDELLRQRLAVPHNGGFRFVHGMLTESLERSSREGGRWRAQHAACARMLDQQPSTWRSADHAARLGHHWLEAEAFERALAALNAGFRQLYVSGEYLRAEAILSKWERARDGLAPPPTDHRWGRGPMMRARLALERGLLDEADSLAAQAARLARRMGWVYVEVGAELCRSRASLERGDLTRCAERLTYVEATLEDATPPPDQTDAPRAISLWTELWRLRGAVLTQQGRFDVAERCYRRAQRAHHAAGQHADAARFLFHRGVLAKQAGRLDDAARLLKKSRRIARRVGLRRGVAACTNRLGDIARRRGELDEAEALYRQALDTYQTIGAGNHILAEVNLARLQQVRGRHAEAAEALMGCLEALRRERRRPLIALVEVMLMCSAAAAGDWGAYDEHGQQAARLLQEGFVDVDVVGAVAEAAHLASEAGELVRAELASEMTRGQVHIDR